MYVVFSPERDGVLLDAHQVLYAAREALKRAIERDGRFTATLNQVDHMPRGRKRSAGYQFTIERVRLTTAKPYCGQHPGECLVNPFFGPRKKANHKYLEWEDWIAFHEIVNDVLDRLQVEADAWTNPQEPISEGKNFYVRRDNKRRRRWEWEERYVGMRLLRVWNAGTPDQFEPDYVEEVRELAQAGGMR